MAAPLVSCIMPTRARTAFALRAIEYFQRQDWPERELVILEDGEPDPALAARAATDPRIRHHVLDGQHTVGAKRNAACELARGSLIAHWDDDDWYPTWRLRRQVAAATRSGADVCGSTQLVFWDPAAGAAWTYRYVGRGGMLVGTSLLYARAAWERAPFADVQVGEDVLFVRSHRGSLHDLDDATVGVALVHERNTSRKRTTGAFWTPRPVAEVTSLLGADVAWYRQLPVHDGDRP
jgi:glycosyltransferase involved in cell wall biosynthesis